MPTTTSGDVDLQVVIQSLLDAKGFEEFKAKLKELTDSVDHAKHSHEGFAESQKVSTREIKVLVAELLRSIGVTEGAGAAGRVAAEGFLAMGDAANYANLAMASTGLFAVLALPSLYQLVKGLFDSSQQSEELAKKQEAAQQAIDKLSRSIADALPHWESLAEKIKPVPQYLKEMIAAGHDVAIEEQRAQMRQLTDSIEEQTTQYAARKKFLEQNRVANESLEVVELRMQLVRGDSTKTLKEQAAAIEAQKAKLGELITATNANVTVDELHEKGIKATAAALKAKREADEKAKKSGEELESAWLKAGKEVETQMASLEHQTGKSVASILEGQRGIEQVAGMYDALASKIESAGTITQRQRDQDILGLERWRDKWTKILQDSGTLTAEQLQKMGNEYTKLGDTVDRQAREMRDSVVKSSGEMLGALASLFGKNKALKIAEAIADTYAAADAALLAGEGTPAGWAMAAATIVKGLANVAQIEKVGFDNPINDLAASRFGRKFADDVLDFVMGGFNSRMGELGAGGTHNTYYHQSTTINRGTSIGSFHAGGFFGENKTELLKKLERELVVIRRLEGRTTI